MLTLFSANGCPFAQRTRALLALLDVEFDLREIDLRNRDPDFLEKSPTGKVPLLVHGETVLYESQVINDYLAEKLDWAGGYAEDPASKARQRLAMKQWDDVILPLAYYRPLRYWPFGFLWPAQRRSLRRELDQLERTVSGTPPESMLGLHCAPFWARMKWLRSTLPVVREIEAARPALSAWLESALALEAVEGTLPEREETIRRYRRSQRQLLLWLGAGVLALGAAYLTR